MAREQAAHAALIEERPQGNSRPTMMDGHKGAERPQAHDLVDEALVDAIYQDCYPFPVPGSERLEKIRIRRLLEAAAPRLVAALKGDERR